VDRPDNAAADPPFFARLDQLDKSGDAFGMMTKPQFPGQRPVKERPMTGL
jgi:hypothetical protein